MSEKILYQGAEALLIEKDNKLIKKRIKKSYRIPEIDEKLRKLRTRSEARIMEKLQGKINVPKIIKVNEEEKEIIMQFIEGKKLSEFLDKFTLQKQLRIAKEIGKEVAKIHDLNIIHGDLTTSNMILVDNLKNKQLKQKEINKLMPEEVSDLTAGNNPKIFFIDFGLSFSSHRIEDKAVDLHLLRQALEAKHFLHYNKLFKAVLLGYKSKDKQKILLQLKKVELRGRYK